MRKQESQFGSTKNYALFANHPKNRQPSLSNVEELKRKISLVNHLDANPIIVTDYDSCIDDNTFVPGTVPKFFICQGMHRLLAAQELGLTIYYIYKAGLNSTDVQNLNTAKVWAAQDWLEFHQDKPDYRDLKIFKETHGLTLSIAKNVLALKAFFSALDFENGFFSIPDKEKSIKIAVALNEMSTYLPSHTKKVPHTTRFVRFIITKINQGGDFDLGHLVRQVQKYPHKVLSTPNEVMAKEVITSIYNHQARGRAKI